MSYITEERRMIQEQAREFTLNEVLPVANRLDPETVSYTHLTLPTKA